MENVNPQKSEHVGSDMNLEISVLFHFGKITPNFVGAKSLRYHQFFFGSQGLIIERNGVVSFENKIFLQEEIEIRYIVTTLTLNC